MSDNIPLHIQANIVKRLPVKSVIHFRSVSKAWKSLIDSSHFIASYRSCVQHLLGKVWDFTDPEQKYVSVIDDGTFSQPTVNLTIPKFPTSPLFNPLVEYNFVGCSHGLLCFYGDHQEGRGGHEGRSGMAVIWNPSIRKVVAVVVPNVPKRECETILGFGVCLETTDPKIVKIRQIDVESDLSRVTWQVDVFELSTGAWRSSYNNLLRKSIKFGFEHLDVAGFLYWPAYVEITVDGENMTSRMIISFDLETEEFGEVSLPDCLAEPVNGGRFLLISKLRNSLVVLDYDPRNVYVVWLMEEGVSKSFTKLFTVNVNSRDAFLVGFRKSGAPIVEAVVEDHRQLVVYEPNSKHTINFWTHRKQATYYMYSYMETLLLLDQPDLMVYTDIRM